mmetsp:Transcript_16930/g.16599  ORF Transcript_16930/g.16599 Transcript_16930/m.16599 type:complete len:125 (+) Transcript_16930:250-624(+)
MGNKVNILFAGKILDSEKTLTECKVENKFVLHVIFKNINRTPQVCDEEDHKNVVDDENEGELDQIRNYARFSEFLQRAAVIQQQINDDRNMNNPRLPNRPRTDNQSIFDRARPNSYMEEDEGSK